MLWSCETAISSVLLEFRLKMSLKVVEKKQEDESHSHRKDRKLQSVNEKVMYSKCLVQLNFVEL